MTTLTVFLGSCGRWRRLRPRVARWRRVGNVLERCYGSQCFRV